MIHIFCFGVPFSRESSIVAYERELFRNILKLISPNSVVIILFRAIAAMWPHGLRGLLATCNCVLWEKSGIPPAFGFGGPYHDISHRVTSPPLAGTVLVAPANPRVLFTYVWTPNHIRDISLDQAEEMWWISREQAWYTYVAGVCAIYPTKAC